MYRGTHDALFDERNDHVLIYVNGELIPRDQAKISVFDSGFLIGDGLWEGLRLHHDTLVFLDEHLNRLYQGAKAIALDIGMTREEITDAMHQTIHANDMHDGVHVRLMVTRGIKKTPSQDPRLTISSPTIVIIAEHKQAKLNQVIQAGADEALMLDVHGAVSTCNATNFFIVVNEQVWTSTGQHCLNGITRRKIIEVCRAQGIPASTWSPICRTGKASTWMIGRHTTRAVCCRVWLLPLSPAYIWDTSVSAVR